MITLRRAGERRHERRRKQDTWLTFDPRDGPDPLDEAFGCLEILGEHRLPPGASVAHPQRDAEIVTYVREGALTYADSMGHSGVIHTGEFQHMTARRGVRHRQTNASRSDWAHVFQIWLCPSEADRQPFQEQKRFSAAERRGVLRIVASSDGRRASLRIHQDALMCSAMLDPGQHVVHELAPGRSAWLHVVKGEVTLGDMIVGTGDGAGLSGERSVSLTAREETEILLVDLGEASVSAHHTKQPHAGGNGVGLVVPIEIGRRPILKVTVESEVGRPAA
ncbi:MAG TPA: pirin family protein [Polyangia bacterium]|nr:pirin family protein [Polyangia bacterium]